MNGENKKRTMKHYRKHYNGVDVPSLKLKLENETQIWLKILEDSVRIG